MRWFVALTPATAASAVSCAAFAPPRAAFEIAISSSICPATRCWFCSASVRRSSAGATRLSIDWAVRKSFLSNRTLVAARFPVESPRPSTVIYKPRTIWFEAMRSPPPNNPPFVFTLASGAITTRVSLPVVSRRTKVWSLSVFTPRNLILKKISRMSRWLSRNTA